MLVSGTLFSCFMELKQYVLFRRITISSNFLKLRASMRILNSLYSCLFRLCTLQMKVLPPNVSDFLLKTSSHCCADKPFAAPPLRKNDVRMSKCHISAVFRCHQVNEITSYRKSFQCCFTKAGFCCSSNLKTLSDDTEGADFFSSFQFLLLFLKCIFTVQTHTDTHT